MTREEYFLEALSSSLEEHGALELISGEQRAAIAKDLAMAASMEGECFGRICIPNPAAEELRLVKAKAANAMEELELRANLYRRALAKELGVNERSLYIRDGSIACDSRSA